MQYENPMYDYAEIETSDEHPAFLIRNTKKIYAIDEASIEFGNADSILIDDVIKRELKKEFPYEGGELDFDYYSIPVFQIHSDYPADAIYSIEVSVDMIDLYTNGLPSSIAEELKETPLNLYIVPISSDGYYGGQSFDYVLHTNFGGSLQERRIDEDAIIGLVNDYIETKGVNLERDYAYYGETISDMSKRVSKAIDEVGARVEKAFNMAIDTYKKTVKNGVELLVMEEPDLPPSPLFSLALEDERGNMEVKTLKEWDAIEKAEGLLYLDDPRAEELSEYRDRNNLTGDEAVIVLNSFGIPAIKQDPFYDEVLSRLSERKFREAVDLLYGDGEHDAQKINGLRGYFAEAVSSFDAFGVELSSVASVREGNIEDVIREAKVLSIAKNIESGMWDSAVLGMNECGVDCFVLPEGIEDTMHPHPSSSNADMTFGEYFNIQSQHLKNKKQRALNKMKQNLKGKNKSPHPSLG